MGFKTITSVALLAGSLFCTSCSTTSPKTSTGTAQPANFQQAAQQYLPGTWNFQYSNIEPKFEMVGTSTYLPNGTADYRANLVVQGQSIPVELGATWKVLGNKMVTVVTKSSMPEIVPVGMESTDTIHELTRSVFRYTDDEEGMTVTETRVVP
jgi:hypothetical protein